MPVSLSSKRRAGTRVISSARIDARKDAPHRARLGRTSTLTSLGDRVGNKAGGKQSPHGAERPPAADRPVNPSDDGIITSRVATPVIDA